MVTVGHITLYIRVDDIKRKTKEVSSVWNVVLQKELYNNKLNERRNKLRNAK